jgi:Flp pilus assembly protein TadG
MARIPLIARALRTTLGGHERGQSAVLVVPILALFAVAGVMVIDAGLAFGARRDHQTTADLAALAAVHSLPDQTAAQTVALDYLASNDFDVADPDLGVVITFPATNQIRVRVTDVQDSTFGGVFGVPTWNVSAAATAELQLEPLPYSLMAMNETACASLYARGQADIDITGGGATYTRSTCVPDALRTEGQADISAAAHEVVGEAFSTGTSTVTPAAAEGSGWIEDPFYWLVQPTPAGPCYGGPYNLNVGSHLLSPGRYCQELLVSTTGVVTLLPGIYVFEMGLNVESTGSFTSAGAEVLLYNTCLTSPCSGAVPGNMRFAGATNTNLTGHSAYGNVVIWFDRTAGPGAELILQGDAASGLNGSAYLLTSKANISGSAAATTTVNMSIVADTIEIHGNGQIDIPYDGTTAPKSPVAVLID